MSLSVFPYGAESSDCNDEKLDERYSSWNFTTHTVLKWKLDSLSYQIEEKMAEQIGSNPPVLDRLPLMNAKADKYLFFTRLLSSTDESFELYL